MQNTRISVQWRPKVELYTRQEELEPPSPSSLLGSLNQLTLQNLCPAEKMLALLGAPRRHGLLLSMTPLNYSKQMNFSIQFASLDTQNGLTKYLIGCGNTNLYESDIFANLVTI
jgi:hypothetical protein